MIKQKRYKRIVIGAALCLMLTGVGFSVQHLMSSTSADRLVSAEAVRSGHSNSRQSSKPTVSQPQSKQADSFTNKAAPVQQTAPATTQPTTTPAPNPPARLSLYVNNSSSLAQAVRAWSAGHPQYAGALNQLIGQPMAEWYGGWNSNVQTDTDRYVSAAAAAGQVPVLIAYNIPNRDCGSYSVGGVSSAAAYHDWIQAFARGIGQNRSAIVIVEPDALASSCYSNDRAQMIRDAVSVLRSSTGASIYLDAGHANWQSSAVMAARLNAAGVAGATGFSLNISNFQTTAANTAYGTQLSGLVGGKHFIIDTSRNGNGPTNDNQWCNPAGRAVGQLPSLQTGQALVDAYIWAHGPGGSDGTCGPDQAGTSAPSAGIWWPESALEILRNSGWL